MQDQILAAMASEEILAVLSYATGTPLALREAPHHAGQTFLYASPRLQDRAMATEESSHKAYKEIRDHGYFHIHKASLGERLTKPSAPWSPDSLRIWYDYLDNVSALPRPEQRAMNDHAFPGNDGDYQRAYPRPYSSWSCDSDPNLPFLVLLAKGRDDNEPHSRWHNCDILGFGFRGCLLQRVPNTCVRLSRV